MTRQINPQTIRKAVHVSAPPERAFAVFTEGMGKWWLKSHSIGASPLAGVTIEPRPGGRWFETGENGSTCDWGRVRVWEPPHRLVLVWSITADWRHDPALDTEVEVRFALDGAGTRVTLEHRKLDAYGAGAAEIATALDGEKGWSGLLASFANAMA